jgi:uncharacterized membrane protein
MPFALVHAAIVGTSVHGRRVRAVSKYEWALFLHVTGAFLFLGGAVIAGVFSIEALRRERPSEIAALLGLARWGVAAVSIGVLMALVFGLWLVDIAGYDWGSAWIVWSLVLWVLTNALGGIGGRRDKETRLLAERLASEDDAPSPELRARLRDPIALSLSWGSGLVGVAILALMIWKPGA